MSIGRWILNCCLILSALCASCSHTSPSELFRLQAKCADEARAFESQWKESNGTDFEILLFRHHYHQAQGNCYSLVYFGHPDLNFEMVYDALAGTAKPPLVTLVGGNDQKANNSEDHKKLARQVRDYMEEDTP